MFRHWRGKSYISMQETEYYYQVDTIFWKIEQKSTVCMQIVLVVVVLHLKMPPPLQMNNNSNNNYNNNNNSNNNNNKSSLHTHSTFLFICK